MVKLCSHNGNVFAIEPPITVELVITESEPGVKGDTATGATKPAIVETGAKILVPLFVNQAIPLRLIPVQENIFQEYNIYYYDKYKKAVSRKPLFRRVCLLPLFL